MNNKPKRKKKCKACKEWFMPERTLQPTCGFKCAIELTKIQREKKDRKETKQKLQQLKPLSKLLDEAQVDFNSFIRLRDAKEPCISCQRHHQGKYDAGHFLTRGAHPELRFEEDNCHKQCSPCNTRKSGNVSAYRVHLIEKIGIDRVDWLEGPHEPKRYTKNDAKEIKALYKDKIKELKINKGELF